MMVKQNQGSIRNKFKIALAQKETRDGKRYTYRAIQQETGIATSTLTEWAKGTNRNYASDTLAALCFFFECQPADLLEYVPPVTTVSKVKK